MRCVQQIRMMAAVMLLLGTSNAWAADADKPCNAPEMPLRPIMSTHGIPPYPEVSVMTSESGTTLLQVAIGADGVPTKTSVVTSSGSLRLDAAAADYVKNTWRWNAPVKNCQPIAVETRVSIKWDLRDAIDTGPRPPTITMDLKDYPSGAKQRHEQGAVALMVVVIPNGAVALTRVTNSSGFPELDSKSEELAKTWHFTPATLDGHPVLTLVYLVCAWSLDPKK